MLGHRAFDFWYVRFTVLEREMAKYNGGRKSLLDFAIINDMATLYMEIQSTCTCEVEISLSSRLMIHPYSIILFFFHL